MSLGLNCLVKNISAIRAIGAAMRSMSDTIISSDANAKVTAKDLYNKLKKAGVDIDLESAAYIYADAFANDINNFSNFETDAQLKEYAEKYPPVSGKVKQALKDAGYKKINKDGKDILDWTKLMMKTEDEIRQEIKEQNFKNENEIFNSLQNEYKQIVSTAIIKAKNDLSRRNEPTTSKQKNAIDKVADLQVRGLFSDFRDDYSNALNKAIGANNNQLDAMNEIDDIGKAARSLQQSGLGTNNYLGQVLQDKINNIVSKARFKDASWLYKIVKSISNVMELANLAILNNLGNRGQNALSGKVGVLNSSLSYGMAPKEIQELASATKKDVIRNGGIDFGDVTNMFNGDRHASEKLREWINKLVSKDGKSQAANWWFSQIMGTAALNGVDNLNKIKNTWVRFMSGMEDILVSKGMTRKEATEKLHEELFGQKWADARDKASSIMLSIQQKSGSSINITKETIERFTADVIKAELINNKIITEDELNAAWEAGYKSSGLEMGHVANNPVSASIQKLKQNYQDSIDKALSERKYNKAAFEVLKDMLINKMLMRFAGGGTNWVVLKLEKGGLGLFTGLLGRAANHSSYTGRRSLSQMTNKEIEENIYNRQRVNDRTMRGVTGLTTNVALLLIASAAFSGDDGEDRKKKLLDWLNKNRWVNKYVNNWLPVYVSGYLAWQQQKEKGGIGGISNPYESSPGRNWIKGLFNKNDDFGVFEGLIKASSIFSDDEDMQAKGWGELGKVFGSFFNFNPLPYKVPKDVFTIVKGITGPLQPYQSPKSFMQGYTKFGMFDWPKRGTGEEATGKLETFKIYSTDKQGSEGVRESTPEEIKSVTVRKEKLTQEKIKAVEERGTIWLNKYGELTIDPDEKVSERDYKDATAEEIKDLKSRLKKQADGEAKKEIKF